MTALAWHPSSTAASSRAGVHGLSSIKYANKLLGFPFQVAEGLRQRILALYDAHLATDGRALDYEALKKDPDFANYVTATAELQRVDLRSLDQAERMCFFINLYNALIIHSLAVYGPETNTIARSAAHLLATLDYKHCLVMVCNVIRHQGHHTNCLGLAKQHASSALSSLSVLIWSAMVNGFDKQLAC